MEGLYPHYLFLYKDILDILRTHLKFRPHVQELVSETLSNVTEEIIEDDEEKDIIFVGVHARKTDYANHLQVRLKEVWIIHFLGFRARNC